MTVFWTPRRFRQEPDDPILREPALPSVVASVLLSPGPPRRHAAFRWVVVRIPPADCADRVQVAVRNTVVQPPPSLDTHRLPTTLGPWE